MGVHKLQGNIFNDHLGLKTGSRNRGLSWLKYADVYDRMGLVNYKLLEHLIHADAWYSLYEKKKYYELTRSIADRTLALFIIALLSPLFLLIALAIKSSSRGPIFYSQLRAGRFATPFRLWKFRTMTKDADGRKFLISNEFKSGLFKNAKDERITPVGRLLRRWSLDELPQLWNILKGDMLLVGPRPLCFEDTCTIPERYYNRFVAKPGITGLWQAKIRGSTNGRAKLKLDCMYVDIRSWKTDIHILLLTVPVVLSGKGAY